MFTGDCSVSALISVPARTVVFPLTLNFLPLRLRTIGGAAAPRPPAPPRPACAPAPAGALGAAGAPGPPRPAAAPGAGAAPLGAPPPRAPPPALIPMRPKSPLHTAAFQVGSILHALSSSAIPLSITT